MVLPSFKCRNEVNEISIGLMTHGFQSADVLLGSVMEMMQFTPTTVLQSWNLDYLLDMCLVDQFGTIITDLQAFDSFCVVVPRTRQSFYGTFGSAIFQGVSQICQFYSFGKMSRIAIQK